MCERQLEVVLEENLRFHVHTCQLIDSTCVNCKCAVRPATYQPSERFMATSRLLPYVERSDLDPTHVRNIRYLDALPGVGKTTWCLSQLLAHRQSLESRTTTSWYVGPTYDLLLQVAVDYLDLQQLSGVDRPKFKVMLSANYANKQSTRSKKGLQRLQEAGCLLMQGSDEDAKTKKSYASPAGSFFLNHVASDRNTCTYFLTHDLLQCLPSSTTTNKEEIIEALLSKTNLWFDEARRCTTKSKNSFKLRPGQFTELLTLLGLEQYVDNEDPIQIPPATVAVLRDCMYCSMHSGEAPDLASLQAEYPSLSNMTAEKLRMLSHAMSPKQDFTALLNLIASHRSTVWFMPPSRNSHSTRPTVQAYPLYVVEDVFRLLCNFRSATLMAAYFRCSEMYFTIRQSLIDLGQSNEVAFWENNAEIPYPAHMAKRKDAIKARWHSLRITYLCKSADNFFLSKNSLVSGVVADAADVPKFMEDAKQKGHVSSGVYATATRHAMATGRPSLFASTYPNDTHSRVEPWRALFNRALSWAERKAPTKPPLLVVNKALNTSDARDDTMDDGYSEFLYSPQVLERMTKLSSRSYGLNTYQDRTAIVYLAALNLDDSMSRFLTRRLSSPTRTAAAKSGDASSVYSVQEDTVIESAVQAICRTAVRNLKSTADVHVLVGTQALAKALKRHMMDAPRVFCAKDPLEFLSWTKSKLNPPLSKAGLLRADPDYSRADALCRKHKSTLQKAVTAKDPVAEAKSRKLLDLAIEKRDKLKQLFQIDGSKIK